ncbi:MAG: bacillithiol biosynthesis deacetylase BshB1 [Saprospiraceae bacterium]|jgi:bacillithiol biosynthesis deacetylase BshB1
MKVDILAIGVHPDDIELGCAGTILKHIELGYIAVAVDLTEGELGTRGSGPIRLLESQDAAKILGLAARENLGMADGFFEHSKENILKISAIIRKYQPDIVLANAVRDRHPDHGRASKLISDACFYSGLQRIEQVDENGNELKKWRPKVVYHYIQDRNLNADFVVDITPYMDKKIESILAYKTQFYDPDATGPKTPISGKDFLEFNRAKNRTYGRDINAEYAEGFTIERTIGVKDLFDLI